MKGVDAATLSSIVERRLLTTRWTSWVGASRTELHSNVFESRSLRGNSLACARSGMFGQHVLHALHTA